MSKETIIDDLKEILMQVMELSREEIDMISNDTDLVTSFDISSIDAIEFIILIEKQFSIYIDDNQLGKELIQNMDHLSDIILKIKNNLVTQQLQ